MADWTPYVMPQSEYEVWIERIEDGLARIDDPLVQTLVAHISALRDRIDKLLDPETHGQYHGTACRCYTVQCACAYDYPTARCMWHEDKPTTKRADR